MGFASSFINAFLAQAEFYVLALILILVGYWLIRKGSNPTVKGIAAFLYYFLGSLSLFSGIVTLGGDIVWRAILPWV